jgi:hypothetical protein
MTVAALSGAGQNPAYRPAHEPLFLPLMTAPAQSAFSD